MKKFLFLAMAVMSFGYSIMQDDIANVVSSNVVTLTTANTAYELLALQDTRRKATFINDSDTTIYINEGYASPTASFGVRLNANGGSYEIDLTNPSYKAWYAICSTGNKQVRVTYGVRK